MPQLSATYNAWLVALSFAVAVLTSYTAVDVVARVTANRGLARNSWLVWGAIALTSGTWCAYYIGMLSYHLPVTIRYDIPTVALSLLAAVPASFTALYVVSRERRNYFHAAIGSVFITISIAAMHYEGTAAMRLQAMPVYDLGRCVLSAMLAAAISFVGLILLFYLRDENRGRGFHVAFALTLGIATPWVHYTGMNAVSFTALRGNFDFSNSVAISPLDILGILGAATAILGFALVTSLIDRRITGLHRLRESEREMLRALIDHIPHCMFVKDTEGRYVLANAHLARTLGLKDPQALIGKTDYNFFPSQMADQFSADEQRVMQSGEGLFEQEEMGSDSTGRRVSMLTTKLPLRDSQGQTTGIAGVGRDISDRKKSEEALRETEKKYRDMFDEALVGMFKVGPDGHLIEGNPAMASVLGYESKEELSAFRTEPLSSIAVSQARYDEIMAEVTTAGHVRAMELAVYRKDRSVIWISISVRAQIVNGELTGFKGSLEDITERRTLREQLLQAQKLESVGQLAAGIAHEINTPVQYIGDNVRFLKDTFGDLVFLYAEYAQLLTAVPGEEVTTRMIKEITAMTRTMDVDYLFEEIPKAIEQTLEGVARVSGLVGAMKEFSHPGTGEKVPLDINHAIESTITVCRNEWKYVADMKVELDPGLPRVACLPGEFNQVVLNMIVNAAHAIEDAGSKRGSAGKGVITIRTRTLSGCVEVRIEDTGTGIPESARQRIFDPFFTTKEIGKGTGQGLAIARSVVVDKHQGTIGFETEEGRGTSFIIRLPCEAAQAPTRDLVVA